MCPAFVGCFVQCCAVALGSELQGGRTSEHHEDMKGLRSAECSHVVLPAACSVPGVNIMLPEHHRTLSVLLSWAVRWSLPYIRTSIKEQTPWPLVRERTIPTERPPLVDEI
jgi:hypothetical protein